MGIKITDMTDGAPVTGVEIIPTSKSAAPRRITTANISSYVIDQIEALSAGGALGSGNSIYLLQSGVLAPVAIDTVLQRALDTMWGKAAETSLADADKIPLYEASPATEHTVTLSTLAEYVRGKIEAAILDVSDLADGSGTLATTDYMLVTQGTTAKQITVQDLYDAIYTGLAAHVAAAANQASPTGTDVLYLVRGGTEHRVTLANLATYVAGTTTLSGSGTTNQLTKWTGTNTLGSGPSIATEFASSGAGSDDELPTSLAVRTEMDAIVADATDIGAALASTDEILVYDASAAGQKAAALSRVKTFVDTVGTYKTLWIPASDMIPSTTDGATANTIEYGTNDMTHKVMTFAGATADDFAEWDLVMPEAWDRSTIKYKVYWTNGHADANTDEWVNFYLSAGARSNDDALDAALGTPQDVLDQLIVDDDVHVTAASSALTVGGTPALGDLIHFKLGRDYDEANGGTAMDVDAHVLGVLIQYRENLEVAAW